MDVYLLVLHIKRLIDSYSISIRIVSYSIRNQLRPDTLNTIHHHHAQLCIFITMHIHFFLFIFISMHIHFYTYSSLCIVTSLCLYKPLPKPTQEGEGQIRTATQLHRYVYRAEWWLYVDYRLSGWLYNKLCASQFICRCYLSHRQAVIYEAILWQVQVVL